MEHVCDKQMLGAFQSSLLTGVWLWAFITLQTVRQEDEACHEIIIINNVIIFYAIIFPQPQQPKTFAQ